MLVICLGEIMSLWQNLRLAAIIPLVGIQTHITIITFIVVFCRIMDAWSSGLVNTRAHSFGYLHKCEDENPAAIYTSVRV